MHVRLMHGNRSSEHSHDYQRTQSKRRRRKNHSLGQYRCRSGACKKQSFVDRRRYSGSALDWHSSREREALFSVVGLAKPTLHKDMPALAAPYDHVVIDGPPRANDVARSAIMSSHLILIPLQPSPYDVWAAEEIVNLIKEAQIYRDDIKALFTVNRRVANTAIGRDVSSALACYPFPLTRNVISQRVVFAESAAQGLSVLEFEPKGSAAKEITSLVQEIMEY